MENIIGAENPMQQQGRRAPGGGNNPPPPPQHKCPRCDSLHTKFCYYNNYSLTQPRYYCKSCRRYWTQGGTLRNVPIGGGCRKNKRATIRTPSLRPPGSSPAVRPSNLTAVVPPPPMGSPFFAGGSFLPSLAAMQPPGQGAAANLAAGSQFGGNMALLHGVSLPLKNRATAHHFEQPPTSHYFPPRTSSISPEFTPWSQGFVNTGGSTSSSAATSSGWSCNAGGAGNNQAGPFGPSHWTDNHQGFNPSQ